MVRCGGQACTTGVTGQEWAGVISAPQLSQYRSAGIMAPHLLQCRSGSDGQMWIGSGRGTCVGGAALQRCDGVISAPQVGQKWAAGNSSPHARHRPGGVPGGQICCRGRGAQMCWGDSSAPQVPQKPGAGIVSPHCGQGCPERGKQRCSEVGLITVFSPSRHTSLTYYTHKVVLGFEPYGRL